jgi:protein-L-isoaspartate(D-aspartate) O-methyltransferase
MTDPAMRRLNMVEGQLRTNKVTDPRLIRAMSSLSREAFLPGRLAGVAYLDEDVPLGRGRYLMEPMVFARLVQEAGIGAGDVVLEVGTGCGYGTAVIAALASTVVSVEGDDALRASAGAALQSQGVDNAVLVGGDLPAGHAAQAPYDVIFVSGAVAQPPRALLDQLAESGRLVAVLRPAGEPGRATVWTRRSGIVAARQVFDANTPHLAGFEPAEAFAFQ